MLILKIIGQVPISSVLPWYAYIINTTIHKRKGNTMFLAEHYVNKKTAAEPQNPDVKIDLDNVIPSAVVRVLEGVDGELIHAYTVPIFKEQDADSVVNLAAQLIELYTPALFLQFDAQKGGIDSVIRKQVIENPTMEAYFGSDDEKYAVEVILTDIHQYHYFRQDDDASTEAPADMSLKDIQQTINCACMDFTKLKNKNLSELYFNQALYIYFSNIDNIGGEDFVTEEEAIEILESMEDGSNDYGKLTPHQPYEDWVAGYMWGEIENTADVFKQLVIR